MKLLFISVWSTRKDLRNETFILNIGEEILIKINWSRCWKSVYILAILRDIEILFMSVWSIRIDLRNETFMLNIGERNSNKNGFLISYKTNEIFLLPLQGRKWLHKSSNSGTAGCIDISHWGHLAQPDSCDPNEKKFIFII